MWSASGRGLARTEGRETLTPLDPTPGGRLAGELGLIAVDIPETYCGLSKGRALLLLGGLSPASNHGWRRSSLIRTGPLGLSVTS
jgi:hypothetical protein